VLGSASSPQAVFLNGPLGDFVVANVHIVAGNFHNDTEDHRIPGKTAEARNAFKLVAMCEVVRYRCAGRVPAIERASRHCTGCGTLRMGDKTQHEKPQTKCDVLVPLLLVRVSLGIIF